MTDVESKPTRRSDGPPGLVKTDGPRVYVSQEQRYFDYSDAERFGEVHFLTQHEINGMRNSLRNQRVISEMRLGLADFRPSIDFLVLTGSPITIGYAFWLAMLVASRTGTHKLNLLQWDRESSAYKLINFEV